MDKAAPGAPRSTRAVDGWATLAFDLLAAVPGAGRIGLALLEGGGRRLRFTASERRTGADPGWCLVDAYDDVPLNDAVRHEAPVIGALDDLRERYADFVAAQQGTGHVAVAAVPIVAAGQVLGGYLLYFDRTQPFDRRQRAELGRLGRQLGTALRRAQHHARRVGEPRAAAPPGARVAVHEVVAELAAVGEARAFLHDTLAGWGVRRDVADTAALCLSELVTNAVIHSHGGCLVRVMLHDGVLTAWVRDSGVADAVPLEPTGDPLQVHGRGLQLVEAMSSRWGHEFDADGVSVWFALDVG